MPYKFTLGKLFLTVFKNRPPIVISPYIDRYTKQMLHARIELFEDMYNRE